MEWNYDKHNLFWQICYPIQKRGIYYYITVFTGTRHIQTSSAAVPGSFNVKRKPQTTDYVYYIFEAHFMIETSLRKNCIDCFELFILE